jgi:4-amino-4-deoxy-L-arabinose transferase-like glycosyltransferase
MMVLIRSLARWVPSHRRQGLAGITALILIVHLLSVVLLAGNALSPDERLYISLAENLLATGTFGREPGVPFALVPPLYPLFVAAIFALSGDSLLAVRIAQAIIGTANSLVVFGLATTLFPRRPAVAWLSMLGIGLYPVFFLWDGRILTETVYVLIILLSWWCWTRAVHSPTPVSVLMAGAGFGLSMLIRETLLFFIPIAVVAGLLIIRRQRLRYVVLFTAVLLVTVAPWVARNALVFEHLFFTERTAQLTRSLTGYGYLSPYYREWTGEQAELGTSPEMLDLDNLAYTPVRYVRSLSFARRNPTLYARIVGARLLELWGHPNGLNRLPGPLRWPYQIGHWLLLLLAGGGLWATTRARHWSLLAWCLVLPYVTLLGIFVTPNPRYTLPFLPLVFILAVTGLDSTVLFIRRECQSVPPSVSSSGD